MATGRRLKIIDIPLNANVKLFPFTVFAEIIALNCRMQDCLEGVVGWTGLRVGLGVLTGGLGVLTGGLLPV